MENKGGREKMEKTVQFSRDKENKEEKKDGREGDRIFLFSPHPLVKLEVCFKIKLPLSVLNGILFLCNFLLK